MNFRECIEMLRDGNAYRFTNPNLLGYFYKAPFPEEPRQTKLDGACSAITYWHKANHTQIAPTLTLYDFDDDENNWTIERASCHPLER